MIGFRKTVKTEKKAKETRRNFQLEFGNEFFHESAPKQEKPDAKKPIRQNKGQSCGT